MSPSRIGVEVAVFVLCLAAYVGAGVVFGDGVPPARWIVVFVAAYLVLTGVRLAWRRRRRSGTPPS